MAVGVSGGRRGASIMVNCTPADQNRASRPREWPRWEASGVRLIGAGTVLSGTRAVHRPFGGSPVRGLVFRLVGGRFLDLRRVSWARGGCCWHLGTPTVLDDLADSHDGKLV